MTPHRPFATCRAILALMLREMASTYGRSPGGYLWMVIEPLAGVALLAVAFSMFLPTPPLGRDFALFYATGLLPFTYYSDLSMKIGQSMRAVRPLFAYPAITHVDAILARFLLNSLTALLVFALVTGGLAVFVHEELHLRPFLVLDGFVMLAALALGFGTLNCFLFGSFPVWERLWSIANRPLLLVSGVFFLPDRMTPTVQQALLWNPLAHGLARIRAGLYASYDAPFVQPAYVYGVALAALLLGLLLLRKGWRLVAVEGA